MKRFVQILSLTVASAVVCFVAIEIGLRLFDGVPIRPWENLIKKKIAALETNLAIDYDPLLGYVLKSNIEEGSGDYTFTSGAYGIRMNSAGIKPIPKNGILAVGDSFTGGSEVSDNETWPAYLERALGEPVVNAGAGGYGSDQIILRAERLIPIISPRAVIVDFMVDDIIRAKFDIRGGAYKPYFLIKDGKLVHMNYPVPIYQGRPRELGYLRAVLGYSHLVNWTMDRIGLAEWWLRDWNNLYKWADTDPSRVTCLLLDRLKKLGDEKEFRVILAIQYGSSHIRGWEKRPEHADTVLKCAANIDVDAIDFFEPIKEIFKTDPDRFCRLFVNHDDQCKILGHMSPEGNEFTARGIAAALRRR